MAVINYDQIMRVDTKANLDLITTANVGAVGYADDTMRHYMFAAGLWYEIPNSTEIVQSATRAYANGVWKTGVFPYVWNKLTNSSGIATFYLTDNGLVGGNAVFTEIFPGGVAVTPYGSANSYQIGPPVVSGDLKTVTVTVTQLSTVVLGLVSLSSAGANVDVRLIVLGKGV